MKLSELRPCDNCGDKLFPQFYVVHISQALFNRTATNATLGLTQMFNGALRLAEVLTPDPEAVVVAGDEFPELRTDLLLCQDCYFRGEIDLVVLVERRNEQIAAATKGDES